LQEQQRHSQHSRQDRRRQNREPPHITSFFIIILFSHFIIILFSHFMPVPVMRIRVMRVPVNQPGVAMAV
jgi:hypothetical protein